MFFVRHCFVCVYPLKTIKIAHEMNNANDRFAHLFRFGPNVERLKLEKITYSFAQVKTTIHFRASYCFRYTHSNLLYNFKRSESPDGKMELNTLPFPNIF